MKIILLFFITYLITFSGNAQIGTELQLEIDGLFSKWDKKDSPGAALGVVQNGKLIYSKGYGMADLENKVEISPDSKFLLPSTTKQFTAASIALLAIEGKLDLNDDIREYIPEIPDYGVKITIRHLTHHLSGLRDYLIIMDLAGKSFEEHFTNQDGIDILSIQKSLNFYPGSRHLYSNSGYMLLAEIVSRVSGMTIREFAFNRIFKPLEMTNTFYNDNQHEKIEGKVISYKKANGRTYESFDQKFEAHGDGNLITTIYDLYQWDKNFYHKKVGGDHLIDLMHTNGLLNNGDTVQYAFGLNQGLYKGMKVVWHPGGMLGFESQYIRFPNHNLSIIILSNIEGFNPLAMSLEIADVLLRESINKSEAQSLILEEDIPNKVELDVEELEKFVSLYWNHEGDYSRRIYIKKGKLYYARSSGDESPLIPISNNKFLMVNVSSNVTVKFDVIDDNTNKMFVSENGGTANELITYKPPKYNSTELTKFTGFYHSEEINCKYDIKNKNGRLRLYRNGENLGKMIPIMPNVFQLKKYMTFKFDVNNSSQFSLNVDWVKGILFEKL